MMRGILPSVNQQQAKSRREITSQPRGNGINRTATAGASPRGTVKAVLGNKIAFNNVQVVNAKRYAA